MRPQLRPKLTEALDEVRRLQAAADEGPGSNGGCSTPESSLEQLPTLGPAQEGPLRPTAPAPKVDAKLSTEFLLSLGTIADRSPRGAHVQPILAPPMLATRVRSSLALPAARRRYVQPQLFPLLRSSNALPSPAERIPSAQEKHARWSPRPRPVTPSAPTKAEFVPCRPGFVKGAWRLLRLVR